MAADYSGRRSSNTQLLQELEELSETLYQTHISTTTRRTASLALPRTAVPPISSTNEIATEKDVQLNSKPRSRRMSLSPWRSRPKPDSETGQEERSTVLTNKETKKLADESAVSGKKGVWNWKPIRALSHIGMQKLSCLFSVEVVTVQGLPASMNGLRLSVCVRKKESKDGAVQTMPSRVSQGIADFEETLFVRCHVYFTPSSGTHMKFESRPFLIYAFAVDAKELDFGRSVTDLSQLIQESIEKSFEGTRIRQWDTAFKLSGKAKGGELVLKLGFQIMDKDGGLGIYSQAEGQKSAKSRDSSILARRQSKSSFSVSSLRTTSQSEGWAPPTHKGGATSDAQGISDLNFDELAPPPSTTPSQKPEEPGSEMEDLDLPDFEVVDKGVEIQDRDEEEGQSEENSDRRSASSEVVKEMVHDQVHRTRLTELDSIAQQIKALESMMGEEKAIRIDEETASSQILDADEETVTREFLQLLEDAEDNKFMSGHPETTPLRLEKDEEAEDKVLLPDLGKGLGCVVQTRNGGYLAAMNPLDTAVDRKDTPKLAMQMSKPLVLELNNSGFELLQKMAAIGLDAFSSEILSLMPVDELMGKTAEQIAFEGIASAIIQGRNKEGPSSTAARTIAAVKSMVTAMNSGRKERISTGIWNVSEDPLTVDEILAFSMQKIEAMAVDALKVQADISEEKAPFDVSPLDAETTGANGKVYTHPLASAVPIEDWTKINSSMSSSLDSETVTISLVLQLRDPMRQYEPVGGPMIALVQATYVNNKSYSYNEERRYKVASLHVGGLKVKASEKKNAWDSERHRLTALQWLVAYGMGKAVKKRKVLVPKGPDYLWSISSRVMADMWLKSMRNPDVKFIK